VLPEAVVYVYDNNSSDGTGQIAEAAGAVVRREYQQGKGNVVRRMFQDVEAECYVLVDGDDTYPAEAAPEMVEKVLQRRTDMVVGDRLSSTYFQENKRPFHNCGNSLVRASINRIFKSDIKDIMTGYRAFSYRFVKTFPVLSRGFEIETEMTIHAIYANMALENVVIDYRDRPEGSVSKLNTVSDGLRVIKTIVNLFRNYKPLQFFSFLSALLLLIDLAVFLPAVWIPFRQTGIVERFPTLIVCGFVALAALLSFFNGMVLDSIMQKDRRDFEFRLKLAKLMHDVHREG
jgi:glycosyltransferase involved in cell wall biosynthesis